MKVSGTSSSATATTNPVDGTLPCSAICVQLNFLQGQVLTIIDATYVTESQNKAVKDLIKAVFRDKMKWIGTLCERKNNGGELQYYDRTEV